MRVVIVAMIATMMKIHKKRGFLARAAKGNSSSEPMAVVNKNKLMTKKLDKYTRDVLCTK
jgi:hypothetical protein